MLNHELSRYHGKAASPVSRCHMQKRKTVCPRQNMNPRQPILPVLAMPLQTMISIKTKTTCHLNDFRLFTIVHDCSVHKQDGIFYYHLQESAASNRLFVAHVCFMIEKWATVKDLTFDSIRNCLKNQQSSLAGQKIKPILIHFVSCYSYCQLLAPTT